MTVRGKEVTRLVKFSACVKVKCEMDVEQPSSVMQRINKDDALDLEPPLKKVCAGAGLSAAAAGAAGVTTPAASQPLFLPGDNNPGVRHPLTASLVADKFLLLEQLEGSSLYSCVNVHTQENLVCKVSGTSRHHH